MKLRSRDGRACALLLVLASRLDLGSGGSIPDTQNLRRTPPLPPGSPSAALAVEKAPALETPGAFAPRVVQKEVEKMEQRAERMVDEDPEAAAEVEGALEDIESALATRATADAGLQAEIETVRADLCTKHGFESSERQDCESFMHAACFRKGSRRSHKQTKHLALVQVGDAPAATASTPKPPVAAMLCRTFFRELAVSEGRRRARVPAYAPAPAGLAPPTGGAAPAPAVAEAPAPAPAQPWFDMDPEQGLQEDGFEGRLVDHNDQESQTEDWQTEFGPPAKHRSMRRICLQHPDNEWCQLQMHHRGYDRLRIMRSSSQRGAVGLSLSAAVASCAVALAWC